MARAAGPVSSALPMRALIVICSATLALSAAACGDDQPVGADAGERSLEPPPPSITGGPYDIAGKAWLRLGPDAREDVAAALIADAGRRCRGADPVAVAEYATSSYDFDYPLDAPAAEVLAEGCDADRAG